MSRRQAYGVYVCHGLSAWQARSYEFSAVLFTAAAYPGTLRAAAFIGVCSSVTTILFGSAIGQWIDQGTSRLRTLLTTILLNRFTIVTACIFWALIVSDSVNGPSKSTSQRDGNAPDEPDSVVHGAAKTAVFCILLSLGIVESLARKANVVAMERDWIPVLAPPSLTEGYTLVHVNAIMARIDMVCKLIAPIAVSQFLSVVSMRWGVLTIAISNSISWFVEYYTAKKVAESCPTLSAPKSVTVIDEVKPLPLAQRLWKTTAGHVTSWLPKYIDSLRIYFGSDVWKPSLANCITHASILSITSITVVFLLDSGYSLQFVTAGETISAFFELSSTFVTPFAVGRLARSAAKKSAAKRSANIPLATDEGQSPSDDDDVVSLELGDDDDTTADRVNRAVGTVGLFGILFLVIILVPALPILEDLTWHLPYPIARSNTSPTFTARPTATIILFLCLAASRLGRGTLVLSTQQLAQSRIPASQRSSFAGIELVFESTFGLGHSLTAAIWSKPQQFGSLALVSMSALIASAMLYCGWVLTERGKLANWPSWGKKSRGKYKGLEDDETEDT